MTTKTKPPELRWKMQSTDDQVAEEPLSIYM